VANTFKFTNWVAKEALRLLVNKLEVASVFNTDWNKEYKRDFPIGASFQIKIPQRYTVRDGLQYTEQPIERRTTTVTINQIKGIDFGWDDFEKALEMEKSEAEIREQYLEPASAYLKQTVDSGAALFAYQNTPNIVGILGTDPTNITIAQQARQRLVELACPPDGERIFVIPPSVMTAIVPSVQSFFNPASEISRAYKEGSMGKANGWEWMESMSLKRHIAGTWQGAVTINGANQTGTSLNLNCTNGDTFNQGDAIVIALVNQVNPMTREVLTKVLKGFVIMQSVVATANTVTVQIYPGIDGPGSQYQNVDALPADTAALTLFPGTANPNGLSGSQGLAIHKQAFALVGTKLESPTKVEVISQATDPKTGITVRYVRVWDGRSSTMINRWDMVYGFGVLYAENCSVRVLGA
jgi:P22 coat protein - gene protein 5